MNKKFLFCILVCLSLFSFMGCGTEKLDISNCIDVSYGKYNGKAKIYENSINVEKLTQIPKLQTLTPAMLKGDYKITLVGDKTDLKNGDKVKLSLDYNKDLYKRDFDVELTFEPKEITIEGLPDELTDVKQISKEQWEEIYNLASKQAEKEAKNNDYKNLKLEKVIAFNNYNQNNLDGLQIELIYSYTMTENKTNYLRLYNTLHFKNNSSLKLEEFAISDSWKNKYSNNISLDDILKDVFKPGSYEVIWSADKQ